MIEQTAGSSHEQVDTFLELVGFRTALGSTNDNTVSLVVVLE